MTTVQIDDFECENCNEQTIAELDMNTQRYTCSKCGGRRSDN